MPCGEKREEEEEDRGMEIAIVAKVSLGWLEAGLVYVCVRRKLTLI